MTKKEFIKYALEKVEEQLEQIKPFYTKYLTLLQLKTKLQNYGKRSQKWKLGASKTKRKK